ncbi:MAG: Uma2 family endonuclease [Gemmataceae bacterium]
MSTAIKMRADTPKAESPGELPPLENGDALDQPTFHARYEAMPEHFKAELIEGIVYVASPMKPPHGKSHYRFAHWLAGYEDETPGVEGFDNTTFILGSSSEPQPDLSFIVTEAYGGRVRVNADGYFTGPPELIAEVASSSESIDLNAKRRDYERHGIQEYIVVATRQQRVYWFMRRGTAYQPLEPGNDGVLRSEVFPGLWLDPAAFLRDDRARVAAVLRDGLASSEHAAFVAALASKRLSS